MNSSRGAALRIFFRYDMWSELSNIFRIVSELLLIAIWLISLSMGWLDWGESFFTLSFIYFGSYFLARGLHHLKWKLFIQRSIFLIWVFLVLLISASALLFKQIDLSPVSFAGQIFRENLTKETTFGFWVLLFSLFVMLRGVQIARYPATARELTAGMRFNLLLFAAYAMIFGRDQLSLFLPSFLFFMLFNLAGLSLARIADLSDSYGGRLPGFNLQWAAGIGAAAILVVLLGWASSWLINLDVAQFLGRGLLVLLQLVFGAILLVLSPVLLAIVSAIQFLIQLLAPNLENLLEPAELEAGNQLLEDIQSQITDATHTDPRLFIMLGVLALIVIIAVLQLRWKPWQRLTRGEEGASDIDVEFSLPRAIRNLFPTRTGRKQRRTAKSLIAAARVRHIYAQLMDLCEKLGKPRPRSLTPNEFLPRMYTLFPLHEQELNLITSAYIKVRYGELPETSKEIEEVLDAWKKISLFGKEMLDERIKNLKRASNL